MPLQVNRAFVGFGDLLGCCELAGRDAEGLSERAHGARRGLGATGFEPRDGERVQARLTCQLCLRQEVVQT